jgi:hypothetical protein
VIRSLVFVLGLSLAGAEPARAQIIQGGGGSREPIAWTSLSIGWFDQQGLCDTESNSCWDFGGAAQFRGTFEFPLGRGATIGVAATRARLPLIYDGGPLSVCSNCDADANITQYFANLRIGGGSGFHQVIDLNAGMTVFSDFRSEGGVRLDPEKAVSHVTFMIGYGFAYTFRPRAEIMLVQDLGLVIGDRQSGTADRASRQSNLRVGVRVGLGEK